MLINHTLALPLMKIEIQHLHVQIMLTPKRYLNKFIDISVTNIYKNSFTSINLQIAH